MLLVCALQEPLLGVFSFASGKQLSACLSGGGASGDYTAGGAGSSGNGSGTCASAGGALRGSGRCKAYIFVMHVAEELPAWPESKDRQRVWVSGHGGVGARRVGVHCPGTGEPVASLRGACAPGAAHVGQCAGEHQRTCMG